MTPEEKIALDQHVQAIAKILYADADTALCVIKTYNSNSEQSNYEAAQKRLNT